jgi:hypothetical protein
MEDNIKMDLRKIGLESVDWIHLAQDKTVYCWQNESSVCLLTVNNKFYKVLIFSTGY